MDLLELYWQQTVHVLGWTLLHFLWQGAFIAAFYAVLRSMTQRPTIRYAMGIAALLIMAIMPALTAYRTWEQLPGAASTATNAQSFGSMVVLGGNIDLTSVGRVVGTANLLPWLGVAWLCGVLLLSLNSLRHWRHMQWVLHYDSTPVAQWQSELLRLCKRFGVRSNVRLLQSQHVLTPTLIGWLKPIILIPVSVLAGFTPHQIELVIAHELGHIKRWDYLVNMFQVVLETVLFYHPAVHWISRDVRNLRETCCDDLVIEFGCGSRLDYARTLANLEGLRANFPAPALAASGGMLLARIRRIVGMQAPDTLAFPLRQHSWLIVLLALATLALCLRLPARTQQNSADVLTATRVALSQLAADAYTVFTRTNVIPTAASVAPRAKDSLANALAPRPQGVSSSHVEPMPVAPSKEVVILSAPARPQLMHSSLSAETRLNISDIGWQRTTPVLPVAADTAALMPKAVHRIAPSYPEGALKNDQQGQVSLSFTLTADGSVQNIEVIKAQGGAQFVAPATDALRQWRFDPASIGSTTERYTQVFDFALGHGANPTPSDDPNCKYSTGSLICRHGVR